MKGYTPKPRPTGVAVKPPPAGGTGETKVILRGVPDTKNLEELWSRLLSTCSVEDFELQRECHVSGEQDGWAWYTPSGETTLVVKFRLRK